MEHITISNKYLENDAIGLDAIVLALYYAISPFEDLLKSDYGTLNKYFAMLVVALIMFRLMKRAQKIPIGSPLVVLPLLLVFISWMSSLWSIDLSATIDRNVSYTYLPCFFVAIFIRGYNEKELAMIKRAVIMGGITTIVYLLYNYDEYLAGSYARITLTEGNDPNNLAALLLFPFWLSLYNLLYPKNKLRLVLSVILSGFLLYGVLITGSRGAIVALAIPLVFFGIFYKNIRFIKKIFFLAGIVMLTYFVLQVLPENIVARVFDLESYGRETAESGTRTDIWLTAIKNIVVDMPVWGYGTGVAPLVMSQFFSYEVGIHNTFLNMIIETGVISLPVFVIFLYCIFKRLLILKKENIPVLMLFSILLVAFFLDSYPKKFFWNVLIYSSLINSRQHRLQL